jgi:glycosyltransferase involved in cell wall biosynthesis
MHVGLIVFNLPERGTWFRAYQIGRELAQRGHTVTLVHTAPHERRRFSVQYEVAGRLAHVAAPDALRGSLRSGWDPWGSLARTLFMQAADVDVVHAFECRPTVLAPALALRRRGVPLVIDWCDWFGRGGSVEERANPLQRAVLRPVETFFEERFRTCADATTVINSTLAEKAQALGVPAQRITLLRNGCDTSHAPTLEPQAAARAQLGLPPHTPLLGYAGAIFPRDARLLAAAFDRVHAARPDVRLLVLGYTNVAIEELVANPAAVTRTGRLSAADLQRYLRACDLGWVPLSDTGANRGRWPLKISSYMELGLPFVATAVGDIDAFLTRYPAGRAAAPTPAAVAQLTLDLLADPVQRQLLGATGRALAEGELSWARITDTVEQVYAGLTGLRAPGSAS